jgi:iron complex transport system ATP-binding protein
MILDEPAASLDMHALNKFKNVLSKIIRAGTRVVLITHHLPDIIPEINRVILMKKGRIFRDGPKDEILNDENMRELFDVDIHIQRKNGCHYGLGY